MTDFLDAHERPAAHVFPLADKERKLYGFIDDLAAQYANHVHLSVDRYNNISLSFYNLTYFSEGHSDDRQALSAFDPVINSRPISRVVMSPDLAEELLGTLYSVTRRLRDVMSENADERESTEKNIGEESETE